jgi:hypothetical protein
MLQLIDKGIGYQVGGAEHLQGQTVIVSVLSRRFPL